MNGRDWSYVDNATVYPANSDQNTKVPIEFKMPVYARAIRIYPMTWKGYINMRFEAVYLDI